MAGGAISINLLSNVREAVRGVDDVADAVDEVTDRLHDIAAEGDASTDRMERDFRDLTRAADRTSDELKDKFRQAYQQVRRNSADAADDVVRDQRRMGERSQEVGQEIRQNLGEGIANAARGDFEALSDTIGDTLGGAVAGIGGIGAAGIAAAGALGLGAVVATISTITQDSEAMNEAVSESFREMAENGVAAWESLESQQHRLTDAYDQHADEINRIKDLVGLPFETVAAAWAGNKEAIDTVTAAYTEQKVELRDTLGVSSEAAQATIKGWDGIMGPLQNTLTAYDEAKEKAGSLAEANALLEESNRDQIQRTQSADQARWEGAAAAYAEAKNRGPIDIPVRFTPDTAAYQAEVERIRRQNFSVTVGVQYERRGSFVP